MDEPQKSGLGKAALVMASVCDGLLLITIAAALLMNSPSTWGTDESSVVSVAGGIAFFSALLLQILALILGIIAWRRGASKGKWAVVLASIGLIAGILWLVIPILTSH